MKTILCLVGVAAIGFAGLWFGGYFDADVKVSPKGQAALDRGVQEGEAQLDRGVDALRGKVHDLTAPEQTTK